MTEFEIRECPKCGGRMTQSSGGTLDDAFSCTRPEAEKLERYDYRIQPYVCGDCGCIEFYKEKRRC